MTVQPVPNPSIPTDTHRIAAERAMRLAAGAGIGEALEFYDELSAGERRIVFAMIARAGGRTRYPSPPRAVDVPWWTGRELEAAHKAVVAGARAPWLTSAAKLWRDQQRRTLRALRTLSTVQGGTR